MFLQGMLGMHRRWYDGGQGWTLASEKVWGLSGFQWNTPISIAAWVHGAGADSVHHQFLLEHQTRQESERQSLGGHDAGMDRAFAAAARKFRDNADGLSRTVRIQPAGPRTDFTMQNEPMRRATAKPTKPRPQLHSRRNDQAQWKFPTQSLPGPIPGSGTPRSASGFFWPRKSCSSAGFSPPTFFSGWTPQPGAWPHGLLNVPVGTMNTAILIASSVTVVMAWASLKMRRFAPTGGTCWITILCGVIFLAVKLAYEWPQKFEHFGAFIKKDALEKYEPYLGNHHLAEKGFRRGVEISGHLHNHEALHDPNMKEYEIALDPVNADPTNPSDGSAAFPLRPADGQDREDREGGCGAREHVPAETQRVFRQLFHHHRAARIARPRRRACLHLSLAARRAKLYKRNPEHLANRVEVAGLFWHFVDLVWIFVFPLFYLL